MSPTLGDGLPPLCPRGGHWSHTGNSTPPYRAGTVGQPTPSFYKACHTRGDYVQWTWHATDPPCRAASEDDSWCEALRGRSILFVGDSLSLQMFWSLLHLAPADSGEIGRARRLYDMDFKRGGEFKLCDGRSRVAFVRNDWLVENKWNRSCHFDAANNLMCRSFAKLAASYNTLVLNTGLHVEMRQEAGVIAAHTTLLARWLNTTRHDVIYRTSAPGHALCQEARVPLQSRYVAPEGHRFHWDVIEVHDAVRRSRFEALLPGRVRFIDAATIANSRADRHMVQGRYGGGSVDCLHYCLPGPPDAYNLVLKRLLRESNPPAEFVAAVSHVGGVGLRGVDDDGAEGARHDKLEQAREGHQPRPYQAVGHEATAERRDGAQQEEDSAGRSRPMAACRPALYVYELPNRYRHEGKPHGSGFGVPVASPPGLPIAALYSATTYGTGAAFFETALKHRCRTWVPAKADLYFVPTFTDSFRTQNVCVDAAPGQPKNCSRDALFRRLAAVHNGSGVSYLDARGGADHILLTGHQGFWFDLKPSYEVSYRDRRLRGAMLFSVEEGVRYPWPGPTTSSGIHSTPWSSIVHLASSTPREELPWRSTHNRSVLVAGAFATHRAVGPASKQFNNLRGALHRACLRRVDRCEYASPGASTDTGRHLCGP